MNVHPSAIVHPKAQLDSTVEVGPFSVIGEHVQVEKGTKIGAHVVIDGWTRIGENCLFFPFSSIGMGPQDLKYKGGETRLRIGRENTIREYVTLNRGTEEGGGETVIGDKNFFMAYVHVAHDCFIGNEVVMANAATLGGHITIGDHAILGGLVGVHQFVKIGSYAIVGGCSAVAQDVPPFVSVAGNRAKLYGLNLVGLKRHGFTKKRIDALKGAYSLLFRSRLTMREAIKQARNKWGDIPDVEALVSFVENAERGICR
ncbi:MAG: acyl-ACP--UDP-N-acetylglucosamine O-acyltransferase [Nitrospiria bacterium]